MQAMPTPAVSVLMAVHNGAAHLDEAMASILGQSFGDFELLVVDDGSTDATGEVVARFADERVRLVSIDHGGRSRARNEGAALARGEVLTFLDSDDQAGPLWLERLCAAFTNPAVAVACCGASVTTGQPGAGMSAARASEHIVMPRRWGPSGSGRIALFQAGTFAVRRSVFDATGGYDTCLAFSENTELAIRVAMHCDQRALAFAAVREPLVRIRRTRATGGEADCRARLDAAERILRRHRDGGRLTPALTANYRAIAAVNAYRLGLVTRGIRHAAAAVAANPTRLVHWGRLTLGVMPPLARRFWTRPLTA
jgi:glycosyltransferase involved in cell wall biosynthesis